MIESKVRRTVPQRQDAVGILPAFFLRGVSGSSPLQQKILMASGAVGREKREIPKRCGGKKEETIVKKYNGQYLISCFILSQH